MSDTPLVTAQGHHVFVRNPEGDDRWSMTFPAANELHEALTKVLTRNGITMRTPFAPERYAEDYAAHILADLDQAMHESESTKMPLLERLSWFRKILTGEDYGLGKGDNGSQ